MTNTNCIGYECQLLKFAKKDKDFIKTSSKLEIISIINNAIISLKSNRYVNKTGNSSIVIKGQKGLGKTNTFIKILELYKNNYDNINDNHDIIVIYHDYTEAKLPSDIIREELNIQDKDMPLSKILQLLDIYIIFIADELDMLYSYSCDKDTDLRINILLELAMLGNNPYGHIYTIICGSSSYLTDLIETSKVNDTLFYEKYPLVKIAPHLNGTKFYSHSIRINIKLDIPIIMSTLGIDEKFKNIIYFIAGCNLRTIDRINSYKKYNNNIELQNAINNETNLAESITIKNLKSVNHDSDAIDILNIYQKIIKRNKHILKPILETEITDENELHRKIKSVNWLELQPIEMYKTMKELNINQMIINKYIDQNWIILQSDNTICPINCLRLFNVYKQRKEIKRNIFKRIFGKLHINHINISPSILGVSLGNIDISI